MGKKANNSPTAHLDPDQLAGDLARRLMKRPVVIFVVAIFAFSGLINAGTFYELRRLGAIVGELRVLRQDVTAAAADLGTVTAAFTERIAEAREMVTRILNADINSPEERSGVERDAERIMQDPIASPLEKAIADAHLLYIRDQSDAALEKLRAVANITRGEDDDVAAQAWYRIGTFRAADREWAAAADAYTRAIGLRGDYAEAYNNRGIARARQEQYAEARADFNQSIRLRPHDEQGYYNRGYMALTRCQYEAALADLDVAAEKSPSNAQIYFDRAAANIGMGRVAEARMDLRLARSYALPQANRGLVAEIDSRLQQLEDGDGVTVQWECGA